MIWNQLLSGGLVSFVNFAIHALVTGVIVEATRHTAQTRTKADELISARECAQFRREQ